MWGLFSEEVLGLQWCMLGCHCSGICGDNELEAEYTMGIGIKNVMVSYHRVQRTGYTHSRDVSWKQSTTTTKSVYPDITCLLMEEDSMRWFCKIKTETWIRMQFELTVYRKYRGQRGKLLYKEMISIFQTLETESWLLNKQLQRNEREMEGNLDIIRHLSQLQCMDPI